ncbi:hypothetical protein SAMN06265371_101279 [Lutibacter agarilyticus]|uniref:Uncharacterized protein n=1 Tax=Lutibacter agarilyticus TaxID=1109740 RepID=A0A238VEA8_9FLAO|nr:hypothetical protein [Lutibacter agarilyticus]SNR32498.1 hypothetical protein SAMN06265371_101279 [Lutibacter agarilyticus]
MTEIKVYISLKEAEELIFNRCLVLRENRLNIKRAQALLSICLFVDKNMLSNYNGNHLILFTAVNCFDIPENEENLFINHYKLPQGLIKLSERKVRDTFKNQMILDEYEYDFNDYVKMRNGLLGIFYHNFSNSSGGKFKLKTIKVLQEFNSLSGIRRKLMLELLKESKFPILNVKVDKFVTDNFFRVTWWGKFIVDNYIPSLNINCDEDVIAIKKWLREFLQFDSIDILNNNLASVPLELELEIDFLLGYYLASIHIESFNAENDFFEKLYQQINYDNKDELFCWVAFFISIFNQNILSVYFIKSLRKDVFNIEKLAFELSQNNFEMPFDKSYDFSLKDVEQVKLISEFLELKHGRFNQTPQLIKSKDAKNVFKNNFFEEQFKKIGLDLDSQYDNNNRIQNSCWFSKKQFHLNIDAKIKPSDIIFYVEENSIAKDKLKQLKFKLKPIHKLIDDSKKILIGFNKIEEVPNLCNIYSSFLKDEIKKKIEKIVFILLVDLEIEKIQSMEFANYVKNQKIDLERLFDIEVNLIIKNEQTVNDIEIKRNLKNILQNYRINQMEVIDENFDNQKAGWLLESNTEYLIENKDKNYHYLFA